MFLFSILTLHDKWGWTQEDLVKFMQQVNGLAETVSGGYVKLEDIRKTIKTELNIDIKRR